MKITFKTLDIPAPYAHEYTFEITGDERFTYHFQLCYADRDGMSLAEIQAEGFSGDDDFEWKDTLNRDWDRCILEEVARLKKLKQKEPHEFTQTALVVDTGSWKGTFYDHDKTEYFLQELIQAIFEVSGKENKLRLKAMTINNGQKTTKTIDVSFVERAINISTEGFSKTMSWKDGQKLLQKVYLANYDLQPAKPKKDSLYISFEENIWFDLPEVERKEEIPGLVETVKAIM